MSSPVVSRRDIGLRSERGPILAAVMLSMSLVAIDTTILATAVPTVVADLGGFTQFPWLFSVYVLTAAVVTPLAGKLADIVGRKPVLIGGIVVFVLGSVLCGVAWSMTSLIVFRAIQGLGAGAVQPMAMTIVGDVYTMAERAKVQGYLASVWAGAAVVGPTLGGLFADYLNWRGIFLINVPLGVVAVILLRRLDSTHQRRASSVDWLGALLLTGGGVALLLGLLEGGQRWAWDSGQSIGLFVTAVVMLVGFAYAETRAKDPVLPGWIVRHRVLNSAAGAQFVVGVVLMGLTTYVPLYGQGVLGHGALVSGLALAAMTIGWPIAASQAGRLYLTVGFRACLLIGTALAILGGLLLLVVDPGSSLLMVAAACFVIGLGFGLVAAPSVVAAQSSVSYADRGVVTGASMFSRSVGSAVGVAAFGAIANAAVSSRLDGSVPSMDMLPVDVLAESLQLVFVVSCAVTVLLILASAFMPARVDEP
ncbi:MAG: MDR family MFS transporter, partial [Nocardioides sp.]